VADVEINPDLLRILQAMLNLGSGPNTVGEIAAESKVDRVTVERLLKQFEADTNPKAVRHDVDEGIDETVWFLQIAGAEFLEQQLADESE
jgi:hypothetical protein